MIKPASPNGSHDLRRGIDFIGVSCSFTCHDGKGNVLLHKRSQHCRDEKGNWEFGAGSHEFGETFEDTVRREVYEEYGAKVLAIEQVATEELFRTLDDGTPTHWMIVVHSVLVDPKEVVNNEPDKADEIGWFTFDTLPSPLHSAAGHQAKLIRKHLEQYN